MRKKKAQSSISSEHLPLSQSIVCGCPGSGMTGVGAKVFVMIQEQWKRERDRWELAKMNMVGQKALK